MKKITIEDKVYNHQIPVFYNTPLDNINDYILHKYGIEDVIEERCAGATITLTGKEMQYFLVWLECFKNDPYYVSIMCHEFSHLTFAILRSAGVTIGEESEEAFTYLQQYFVRTFLEKTRNNRR